MILNDNGTYDSMSEEEMEAIEQVEIHRQVNKDKDDQIFCDKDSSPALVGSKVLRLQHQQEEDQRCHIFHTKVGINGRSVKVIIDGGSCHNLASEELCSKLQLVKKKHPRPYKVQWLSDSSTIQVELCRNSRTSSPMSSLPDYLLYVASNTRSTSSPAHPFLT